MVTLDDNYIQGIAQHYNVCVEFVTVDNPDPHDMGPEYYVNRSFSIGRREILLGTYMDPELKLISFFHELGHCTQPKVTEQITLLVHEAAAWKQGLLLAETQGLKFSANALSWALDQLVTYENYR